MDIITRANNDTYLVTDFVYPSGLTLSTTMLYGKKETKGNKHNWPEIYYIVSGRGKLELKNNGVTTRQEINSGDAVNIPPDVFHKVYNKTQRPLLFVCTYKKGG